MPALRSISNLGTMTHTQRRRRLAMFGGALLVVIVAIAVAMAIASGGSKSASARAGISFVRIPQSSNQLGSKNAKATLMVFADMQCPYCREFETQAFPSIVQRYVRTGKLRVVFQPVSILGSDSVVASKAVAAAAQQNKLFDYASTFYANQGQENTGYVTDAFMTKLAKAVPGLNVVKWQSDLDSGAGTQILSQAESAAKTAGVNSTPTFMVAKTGQALQTFQPSTLAASGFYGKLDALTH
jgi:protein-disulfide isomerase